MELARGRSGRAVVAAAVVGLAAAVVTVLTRSPDVRGLATALLPAGFALGLMLALALRTRAARPRSTMGRLNDAAFATVLLALWGLGLGMLGPWAGLVTGAGAGVLLGAALWRR